MNARLIGHANRNVSRRLKRLFGRCSSQCSTKSAIAAKNPQIKRVQNAHGMQVFRSKNFATRTEIKFADLRMAWLVFEQTFLRVAVANSRTVVRLAKSSSDDRLPAYLCCKLFMRERCFVQTRQRKLVHGRGLVKKNLGVRFVWAGANICWCRLFPDCCDSKLLHDAVPGASRKPPRISRRLFVPATNFELDRGCRGYSNPNHRGCW